MLAFLTLCFSLFISSVLGFPIVERDVFNPTITNPRNGTVWVVGSKEQVKWRTDNIPPDSQLTNSNGRVLLGHLENDSLNLDIDHPLAQNFKLRDGSVTVTVPDVPTREDYIIVLMGDSGNASPTFVITSISGGSSSSSSHSSTASSQSVSSSSTSTLITAPIPITGSTITGGVSTTDSTTTVSATSQVAATFTSQVVSSASISSVALSTSQSATVVGSAAAALTSPSAAWSIHSLKSSHLWSLIAAPLALCLLI